MPIRINYEVPLAASGPIAYAAGRGLFEQEQDKYNEGVRQFEVQQTLANAKLGQQESQFARDLNYRQELALLQDRRNQEQLDQRAYQFQSQQSGSAYQREMDRRNRLQQMGLGEMFQVGREERADDRDIAGEERQEERQLSREARMRQDREAEKQYLASNKDAEIILKQGLNQEQLAQAAKQWEERNSRPFPYQGGLQQRMSESESVSMARGILEGTDVWTEGLAAAFESMPPEEASARAFDLRKEALAIKKAENEREYRAKVEATKLQIAQLDSQSKMNLAKVSEILKEQQKEEADLQKARDASESRYRAFYDTQYKMYANATDDDNKRLYSDADAASRAKADAMGFREAQRNFLPGQEALQGGPGSSRNNPIVVTSREELNSLPTGTWVQTPQGVGQKK